MMTTAFGSYDSDPWRRRNAWLASACLAAYYTLSASSDLSLYDSGELALAAVQLGLGHPPGQPLHTLLGHVLSRVTAVAPLVGVNMLSAVPAALTLLPANSIVLQLTAAGEQQRAARSVPWLLALFALHEALWEPASRVEVYALASWLALSAVAYALPLFTLAGERPDVLKRTGGAALLLGLCACSNPVIAVAAGLALAPGIVHAALRAGCLWASLAAAAAGGTLGLLPYVYLPLVAARSDVLVWGGLSDPGSFFRYLTMRDYARNQTLGLFGLLEHAAAWAVWSVEHLVLPVLIVGMGGFFAARSRLYWSVTLFVCASAVVLAMISFNVGWNLEVPDYNGYLGIAYWLAASGAAALFVQCAARQQHWACAGIALCLATGLLSPPAPSARTRSSDRLARTLAEQLLQEAPEGAILVTFADYYAGTLFYLQEVEHKRPDVVVLAYGLSGSSWHWRHLHKRHPEIVPIDLHKRGDRVQRVRDWLKDNANRAVLVEQLPLASVLGLRVCAGGLYFWTGALCDTPSALLPATAQLLSDQLTLLGQGSPAAARAIAEISENIGSGLWRLGLPEAAHSMLLAGVPRAAWPHKLADARQLAAAQQLVAPPHRWARAVALGDPARNLFLAGAVTAASGQEQAAQGYVQAAASLRLPEAQLLLTQTP
jgi:hypothetical protein